MFSSAQRTWLPVLLHAVAAVVELGEGGGELVQVVAQRVEQQVVQDLLQDLWEAEDALSQLPLLLVVQQNLRGLRRFPQSGLVNVSQTSYGPRGSKLLMSTTLFLTNQGSLTQPTKSIDRFVSSEKSHNT